METDPGCSNGQPPAPRARYRHDNNDKTMNTEDIEWMRCSPDLLAYVQRLEKRITELEEKLAEARLPDGMDL